MVAAGEVDTSTVGLSVVERRAGRRKMELSREFNREKKTCVAPGPLPQGCALHPSPHSLWPTNFSPLNKCQGVFQMLLETYPRYTRDSKERAINIPGMLEQKSVSIKEQSAWGDFR